MDILNKVFVCFAAEDRYTIAEPIVYHLKNYGISVWYDRHNLLMGDNRIEKNLIEGASQCRYAVTIISRYTRDSVCTMEELELLKNRILFNNVVVFPVLYDISPEEIPDQLLWIKNLIFKEVTKESGTRETCNHILCKISEDVLKGYQTRRIKEIIEVRQSLPEIAYDLIDCYQKLDCSNLNSRMTLLYSAFLVIYKLLPQTTNSIIKMAASVFERSFTELRLNLPVDYRELWLLENSLCILVNYYVGFCTESST